MTLLDQSAARLMEFDPARNRALRQLLSAVATVQGVNETAAYDLYSRGLAQGGGTVRDVLGRAGVKQLDAVQSELRVLEAADEAIGEIHQRVTALDVGVIPTGVSSARSIGDSAAAVTGVSVNGQVDNPGALTIEPELTNRFVRIKNYTSLYSGPDGWATFCRANAEMARMGQDLLAEFEGPVRAAQARKLEQRAMRAISKAAYGKGSPDARIRALTAAKSEGVRELEAAVGGTRQLDTPTQDGSPSPESVALHGRVLKLLEARGESAGNGDAYLRALDNLTGNTSATHRGPLIPVKL